LRHKVLWLAKSAQKAYIFLTQTIISFTHPNQGGRIKDTRITRRAFFSTMGKGACAAAILSPVDGISAFAGQKTMTPIILDLTQPDYLALNQIGGALKIPNPLNKKRPIIVIRTSETEITALSSRCTHLFCEVPLPVDGVMTCPCHKGQFNTLGAVLKGPPKKSLPKFETVLQGNTLTISAPQDKK
jgi:Rieske Fe-S protein